MRVAVCMYADTHVTCNLCGNTHTLIRGMICVIVYTSTTSYYISAHSGV